MEKSLYEDAWLRAKLFRETSWHPDRLGKRHRIFSAKSKYPMAGLYVEPAQVDSYKEWKLGAGDRLQSLFEHLKVFSNNRSASILFATYDDGTYVVPHWERPFCADRWSPVVLWEFQVTPAEQGGEQFLVLLFREREAAVIFTRYQGLEIDFYGSSEMWRELSDLLYRKVARPCNG
jgi:hypothetical protein